MFTKFYLLIKKPIYLKSIYTNNDIIRYFLLILKKRIKIFILLKLLLIINY